MSVRVDVSEITHRHTFTFTQALQTRKAGPAEIVLSRRAIHLRLRTDDVDGLSSAASASASAFTADSIRSGRHTHRRHRRVAIRCVEGHQVH